MQVNLDIFRELKSSLINDTHYAHLVSLKRLLIHDRKHVMCLVWYSGIGVSHSTISLWILLSFTIFFPKGPKGFFVCLLVSLLCPFVFKEMNKKTSLHWEGTNCSRQPLEYSYFWDTKIFFHIVNKKMKWKVKSQASTDILAFCFFIAFFCREWNYNDWEF